MVFHFCSYLIALKTLAILMTRNGKLPRVADSGYDPFIADVKQPPDSFGLGSNDLFEASFYLKSQQMRRWRVGTILVRVDGDLVRPELLRKTAGDKREKQVMEERLGVKISPFLSYLI